MCRLVLGNVVPQSRGPWDKLQLVSGGRLEGPLREKLPLPGERRPITAHDSYQTNGLLLEDWLQIGLAAGRGLKIEIKDNAALDAVLALCKKHKVPAGRLILNIGIPDAGATPAAELVSKPVSDDRLARSFAPPARVASSTSARAEPTPTPRGTTAPRRSPR